MRLFSSTRDFSATETIYNKRTGQAVAEVKMEDRGFLFQTREAIVRDPSGEILSRTREAREGFFAQRRVADSYDGTSTERTHRTRDTVEGIILPRARTTDRGPPNRGKIKSSAKH